MHVSIEALCRVMTGCILALFVLACGFVLPAQAAPVSALQAQQAVRGWLAQNSQAPFETRLQAPEVGAVAVHAVDDVPVYFIVWLLQQGAEKGFLVLPADDLVEPIVGFFPRAESYSPAPNTPVGALVHQDLQGRMARVTALFAGKDGVTRRGADLENQELPEARAADKWRQLLAAAVTGDEAAKQEFLDTIDDVRVSPLVASRWSQSTSCGADTYNIYTPNNYVCGCVATAMAQLMRYHSHPTAAIGTPSYTIKVDDVSESRSLMGGDGAGGAFDWNSMALAPSCSTTLAERQAISRLTHDAGVAVGMYYTSSSSGADTLQSADAFLGAFGYANAIKHYAWGANIESQNLHTMLNSNLDADLPVVLGITGAGGHAIVCDGYGFNMSTAYHHLNMGWAGFDDAWYNLPNIDTTYYSFNSVYKVVYNVYPSGTGEIVSGRVVDQDGAPVAGAQVASTPVGGGQTATTSTDANGIYSFTGLASNTSYTFRASRTGYTFRPTTVAVGASSDTYSGATDAIGNVWGVDFAPAGPGPVVDILLLDGD